MGEASIRESVSEAIASNDPPTNVAPKEDVDETAELEILEPTQVTPTSKDEPAKPNQDETSHAPEALHQLVVEHSDSIFRLAYSIVSDRALAEDITQDTLVKAWMALPSFRGEGSLKGWILRIAHNTSISAIRARKAVVVDPADLVDVRPTLADVVEKNVENTHAYGEFVKALDELDELSRSILVLREVEGLAYDEISKMLRVPLPTVKTRLLRSRRRLGVVLKGWKS